MLKHDKCADYGYTTFDIYTLAELFKLAGDNGKVLDLAVGTYIDEDGNLGLAGLSMTIIIT